MPLPHPGLTNQIISALPPKISKALLNQCETIDFTFGDILYEPYQPLRYAYFPITGFLSLLTKLEDHEPLEMGLIGNEGMLGATLAFDVSTMTMQVVVQGSGKALRLPVAKLRGMLKEYPSMVIILSRYLYVLMEQLMQSAACTYFHAIELRLARWLLMSHDRAKNDTLELTHEFLASMLGVRRSGVTIAAGKLQDNSLIHYSRGHITILNRKGLEAVSCECYKKMKNIYVQNFAK